MASEIPAVVREERLPGPVPVFTHPDWAGRFPWLVQGITGREGEFDLRLFGDIPSGTLVERWLRLRQAVGCDGAVHARQVHGSDVLAHPAPLPGLLVAERFDGHATQAAGLLLTVSVADCVPISLMDPERRAIALLHGGWRGIAAGILERGIETLRRLAGSAPADLYMHTGPAICGECYEVGPEVFTALRLEAPDAPTPVDLRGVLARRAARAGIPAGQTSTSAFCTRCGGSPFFSHRGGHAGRQMALLAIRRSAA